MDFGCLFSSLSVSSLKNMQFKGESGVNKEEGLNGEKDGGGGVRITSIKDICKGHIETYY